MAVVVGSVREGRIGPTVANWFASQVAKRPDVQLDLIDLADAPLVPMAPRADPGAETQRSLDDLTPRFKAADGFVIVTPEYNSSYPAALKNVVDWHNAEFHAKPVGFVSYGGMAGGLRSVEQLRLVFAALHATTVRDTVSFHQVWDLFDSDGALKDPGGPNAAAKKLLDQMAWWATALKGARSATPYSA
ncbi:NADPH-dependent FMN reductase [Streptomyces griseoviridis]